MAADARVRVIYIAGCSYSGSTLLGLLLGSDPKAIYAGEVNQFMRAEHRKNLEHAGHYYCTCGQRYEACEFMPRIRSGCPSLADLNPAPGFSRSNARLMLSILNPVASRRTKKTTTEYGTLIAAIFEASKVRDPARVYVVDSSKSIHGLDQLSSARNVDLYVLHVVRDGVSVANSYKRRGRSLWYGITAWTLVNVFLAFYIRKNDLNALRISYRSLCESPGAEFERLNELLGIQLDVQRYLRNVKNEVYHLIGGNKNVRQVATNVREFGGIKHESSRDALSRVERSLATWLVAPLNRIFRADAVDRTRRNPSRPQPSPRLDSGS